MTNPVVPRSIFRIDWRDGKPVCVTANLININRSWWTIQHADGTETKCNGGSVPGPDSFMNRWRDSVPEAWIAEANRLFVLACCEKELGREAEPIRYKHWDVLEAMWADAVDAGHLLASMGVDKIERVNQ